MTIKILWLWGKESDRLFGLYMGDVTEWNLLANSDFISLQRLGHLVACYVQTFVTVCTACVF